MAELKTKETVGSVATFLDGVQDAQKREDSRELLAILAEVTGAEPKLWGPTIVAFGDRRLVYESGRELDWFVAGFSPRKQALTLYLDGLSAHGEILGRLGKAKTGEGCLYIKRLADVDPTVLRELISASVAGIAD